MMNAKNKYFQSRVIKRVVVIVFKNVLYKIIILSRSDIFKQMEITSDTATIKFSANGCIVGCLLTVAFPTIIFCREKWQYHQGD